MTLDNKEIHIIGYSGHAYVVCDTFASQKQKVVSYFESEEKSHNPFNLIFRGGEKNIVAAEDYKSKNYFIAIGNNYIREKVYNFLLDIGVDFIVNALHDSATISQLSTLKKGILVSPNATINAFAKIGNGVICNTSCIIEHECTIGDFAHIAPGATLAGNVSIGRYTFVGANSVIKQGVNVGNDVTIGAGAVIIKDIPNGATVVGNPGRIISRD